MQAETRDAALSVRSILLAVGFLIVGALWIREASLIAFTILVGEGTPPVPALATLVLLTAVALVAQRLTRTARWRREALLIYIILTAAFVTIDANGIRQLFSTLTSLRYFAAPGNDFLSFAEQLPAWLLPASEEAVRTFYEGSEGAVIPWSAWAATLIVWGGAFMLLSLSLGCLVSLFRRPWADHERLTFPLAELALRIAPDPAEDRTEPQLLRMPLFWAGFGVAALYDGSNIAHAFFPQVAAIGQSYDFNALLTERPWSALRPMTMTFRPEIIGLGYLVPVDVLLSVWFFYLLFRFENFGAHLFGYSIRQFPFDRPQGMGSYLGLAVLVIYTARKHLAEVVRAAFGGPQPPGDGEEALPARVAFWGVWVGVAGMTAFMVAAGMNVATALAYVLLIYVCALVYARIRAQTGLPITYGVPREQIASTILAVTPSDGHLSRAEVRSEASFAVFRVLVRMTFGQLGAFEMEGIRIARRARLRRSHLLIGITAGLLAGLLLACATHLTAAYNFGWNVIDGGSTQGGYRTGQARGQYRILQTRVDEQVPVDVNTTVARGVGFGLTLLTLWLRVRFLRFPLNPMGLALAGTFGGPIWFPIFLAWLAKSLILRLGGAHTYRRLTPVFLGLAMGHFLIAGGIWGLVGAFSEEVARRYLLWFA